MSPFDRHPTQHLITATVTGTILAAVASFVLLLLWQAVQLAGPASGTASGPGDLFVLTKTPLDHGATQVTFAAGQGLTRYVAGWAIAGAGLIAWRLRRARRWAA